MSLATTLLSGAGTKRDELLPVESHSDLRPLCSDAVLFSNIEIMNDLAIVVAGATGNRDGRIARALLERGAEGQSACSPRHSARQA